MNKLLTILTACGLSACASAHYLKDPVAAQQSISCTTDTFAQASTCDMPSVLTDINGHDNTALSWVMPLTYAYFREVGGEFNNINIHSVSLNGHVDTRDWLFISEARDSNGTKLNIKKIDSDVSCKSGCTTKEFFVIDLDKTYLYKHAQTGIHIKIYGKRGTALINLPAPYVQGFLNYLNKSGAQVEI